MLIGRYNNQLISVQISFAGGFSRLTIKEIQDQEIIKNCKPYLVNLSVNVIMLRVMTHLTNDCNNQFVIHKFTASTD
jgi:hypothetical protein